MATWNWIAQSTQSSIESPGTDDKFSRCQETISNRLHSIDGNEQFPKATFKTPSRPEQFHGRHLCTQPLQKPSKSCLAIRIDNALAWIIRDRYSIGFSAQLCSPFPRILRWTNKPALATRPPTLADISPKTTAFPQPHGRSS